MRGWATWTLVAALLGGLGIATHLTRLHLDLFYGDGSFQSMCDYGSGFNCSEVNGSPYSNLFGWLPISLVAIPAYSVMLMLTLRGRSGDRKSLGMVTVLGLIATLFSVYLAYVSKVLIGSFCLFCVTMYGINLLALILPAVAARTGFSAILGQGLASLGDRRVVGLSLANAMVVSGLAWGAYTGAKDQLVKQTAEKVLSGATTPKKAAASPQAGSQQTGSKVAKRDPNERLEVPLDASVPVKGPANAPVTIVVYEDFQCPFCKRLSSNLDSLLDRDPKNVRVAFRHFPMHKDCNEAPIARSMHPYACGASAAAVCAQDQGQFWPYYEALFKNQANLQSSDLTAYAEQLGLDVQAFEACRRSPETKERIQADTRTGADLGVNGTPAVYINGRRFSGSMSVEVLAAVVDAELKGQTLTAAELRDVAQLPDVTGEVSAPEMITLKGPYGEFEIDSFEASIQNGKAMSKAGVQAASNVTWFEADAACKAAGKRLCTEGEWLTACEGALPMDKDGNGVFSDDYLAGTTYPYGEHYQPGYCNDQVQPPKGLAPDQEPPLPELLTGRHPRCRSSAGVYDLTGNVREWVGTIAPKAAYIGGAFYSRDEATCVSRVESVGPFYQHQATGFRCCRGGEVPDRITKPGRQVGEKLRPFKAVRLDGRPFSSDSLKGKPALLTFWASWCGPCRKELPAYSSIYPELHKKGFEIIAINVDHEVDKARAFLEQNPVTFPVVLDTDNSLVDSFDTAGMPTSFLIDKNGQILMRRRGYDTGDEQKLVKTVEKLLGG